VRLDRPASRRNVVIVGACPEPLNTGTVPAALTCEVSHPRPAQWRWPELPLLSML